MIWFAVIVVLASLFAFAVVLSAARLLRLRGGDRFRAEQTDFSIEELHGMLREGRITPEEFARARDLVASRRGAPPKDGPGGHGFEVLEPRDSP